MNLAVSIPPDLSEEAEDLARRQQKTLGQVVAEALSEYLVRHGRQVTELAIRQRREAGEALIRAARANPLDRDAIRLALQEIESHRAHSDRF